MNFLLLSCAEGILFGTLQSSLHSQNVDHWHLIHVSSSWFSRPEASFPLGDANRSYTPAQLQAVYPRGRQYVAAR